MHPARHQGSSDAYTTSLLFYAMSPKARLRPVYIPYPEGSDQSEYTLFPPSDCLTNQDNLKEGR